MRFRQPLAGREGIKAFAECDTIKADGERADWGGARGVWRRDGGQTGATEDQIIVMGKKNNPGDDAPGPSFEGFC